MISMLATIQAQVNDEMGVLTEQARSQVELWESNEQFALIFAVIMIVWGLANVLMGYRIFRWLMVFYGVIVGVGVGLIAGTMTQAGLEVSTGWPLLLVGACVGAVVGGLLGWYLFYLIVFLFGLGLGTSVAIVIGSQFLPELDPELAASAGDATTSVSPLFLIFALGIGLVVGVLVLLAHRPVIVAATSVYGAIFVMVGTFDLIGWVESPLRAVSVGQVDDQIAIFQGMTNLIAVAVITIIGIIVQLQVTARSNQARLSTEHQRGVKS